MLVIYWRYQTSCRILYQMYAKSLIFSIYNDCECLFYLFHAKQLQVCKKRGGVTSFRYWTNALSKYITGLLFNAFKREIKLISGRKLRLYMCIIQYSCDTEVQNIIWQTIIKSRAKTTEENFRLVKNKTKTIRLLTKAKKNTWAHYTSDRKINIKW